MAIPFSHDYVDAVTEYRLHNFPLLSIGRFSYINQFAYIQYFVDLSAIRIGHFCSIASNVSFFLREIHHPEWVTTASPNVFPFPPGVERPPNPEAQREAEINIGNDVWIGEGARILAGVSIGDGAVIGTGTIVTKNVPPYAICVGSPGRIIRRRFSDPEIDFLLNLQWWEFPTATLRRLAPVICSSDIVALKTTLQSLGPADRHLSASPRKIVNMKRKSGAPKGYRRAKLRRSVTKRIRTIRRILGLKP